MEKHFYNYKPSKQTKNFVMKFSKEVVETTMDYLKNRNQTDKNKAVNDHYYGKLGELAVWHYFNKHNNIKMSPPDFTITSNKSFDCDLKLDKYEIHVKSQHEVQASRFGTSWMLQKTDKLVSQPKDKSLYAFCIVNGDDTVKVLKIVEANKIKYGEPKLDKLKVNKTVIYYDENKDAPNITNSLINEIN